VLYLDAARFDGISSALGEDVSFYQLLSSNYGVELASAEETIEASVAGPREAKLLRCGNTAALLLLSRLTFDTTGHPIEYVRSHYRGDRFRFRQRLERHAGQPTTAGDPTLREATAGDAAALAWVFIAAWRDAYPGIVDDAVIDALDEAKVTDWLGNIVSAANHRTVVAESPNGQVVGFIGFGAEPDDPRKGHVFSLYTHPSVGRRGIGRRLLEHALVSLADRDLHTVTLWVFDGNERALGLYRSAGFNPDGGRRVEPEFGAQEIRLVRVAPDAPPEPGILAVDLATAGA
jgi:ribosomal protein S18 acetylase RimI-like enzyme